MNPPWLSQLMYAVENGVKVFTVNNFQNFSTIRERGGGAGGRKNVPREKATDRCRTRRSSGREIDARGDDEDAHAATHSDETTTTRVQPASSVQRSPSLPHFQSTTLYLFHDLLLRCYLYHCVWSVITAHNLTVEKRDNKLFAPPSNPTSCSTTFNL